MSNSHITEAEILALSEGEALRLCEKTTIIETIIGLTKHRSARVRQRALKEMCPCRVKDDLSEFWERVLEMIDDEAANVRFQVAGNISRNYLLLTISTFLTCNFRHIFNFIPLFCFFARKCPGLYV